MRRHLLASVVMAPVVLCAIALAAVAVAGPSTATSKRPYPEISTAELEQAMAAKRVALIDCNGSESFKEGHIPGAIDFEAHRQDLAACLPSDRSTLVVAYCGAPGCALYRHGAQAASELGYTSVKHLAAGIYGWKETGGRLEF